MTSVAEVVQDQAYRQLHEHGFVGLVDHMGGDHSIVQAARVSYGKGTKAVSEDRGLIRYLMRHRHSTPFEMCEIKLHVKLPIFVERQWIRHRTASVNEYSARYSEMTDEFYVPDNEHMAAQSKANRQGSDGAIPESVKEFYRQRMTQLNESAYKQYQELLKEDATFFEVDEWNNTGIVESTVQSPGLSRELSRLVLPVSNYTEKYWKVNLLNLFHFLGLRMDLHAQREIRDFANVVHNIIQPLYPVAFEAFNDYVLEALTFSKQELQLLGSMLCRCDNPSDLSILSQREQGEFLTKLSQLKGEKSS